MFGDFWQQFGLNFPFFGADAQGGMFAQFQSPQPAGGAAPPQGHTPTPQAPGAPVATPGAVATPSPLASPLAPQGIPRDRFDSLGNLKIKQSERPLYPGKGDDTIEGPMKLTPGTSIDPRAVGWEGVQ